jgi:hypothetical protein
MFNSVHRLEIFLGLVERTVLTKVYNTFLLLLKNLGMYVRTYTFRFQLGEMQQYKCTVRIIYVFRHCAKVSNSNFFPNITNIFFSRIFYTHGLKDTNRHWYCNKNNNWRLVATASRLKTTVTPNIEHIYIKTYTPEIESPSSYIVG